jgi:hypothetical protein
MRHRNSQLPFAFACNCMQSMKAPIRLAARFPSAILIGTERCVLVIHLSSGNRPPFWASQVVEQAEE